VVQNFSGGPIAEPADSEYMMKHVPGIAGFFGGSSIERLPTEVAITEQVGKFKNALNNSTAEFAANSKDAA